MIQRTVLLVLSVLLSSGAVGCRSTVNELAWLAGGWSSDIDGVHTRESWSEPEGRSWMVGLNSSMDRTGEQTRITSEFLRIENRDGSIIYSALPQNHDAWVHFRLVEQDETSAVFANPEHDFPQRIDYRREGDTLHVRIEGVVDGQTRSQQWRWQREVEDDG